jgi:predicted nucleic acid-binding protein
MTYYYWDTSAMAKHYHVEAGTPEVDAMLAEPEAIHIISRLGVVELRSIAARMVRMGVFSTTDFHLACQHTSRDMTHGLYLVVPVLTHHFEAAEQLLTTHATAISLRTLDALQLAVALDFQGQVGIDYFVCADTDLCRVATAEGFAVLNPENP